MLAPGPSQDCGPPGWWDCTAAPRSVCRSGSPARRGLGLALGAGPRTARSVAPGAHPEWPGQGQQGRAAAWGPVWDWSCLPWEGRPEGQRPCAWRCAGGREPRGPCQGCSPGHSTPPASSAPASSRLRGAGVGWRSAGAFRWPKRVFPQTGGQPAPSLALGSLIEEALCPGSRAQVQRLCEWVAGVQAHAAGLLLRSCPDHMVSGGPDQRVAVLGPRPRSRVSPARPRPGLERLHQPHLPLAPPS